MGTFRCGLLLAACLAFAGSTLGQDTNPANPAAPGLPGAPIPTPDTNGPVPSVLAPQPDLGAPVAPDAITNAAPKRAAKPKAAAAPALPSVRGTASKLDTLNMSLTVDAKGKEETFKITSKTRVFADGKPAILSDAKAGENVLVEYHTAKDKSKEALTLKFGGSAPAVEKGASVAPVKKATVKKTPAKKPKKSAKKAAPKAGDTTPGAPVPAPVETIPPGAGTPVPSAGVTPLPAPTPTPGNP
jgi:hypothetical protein